MTQPVSLSSRDGVAIITIDNPPVNALSPGVPEGILVALDTAERDPSVRAIVVVGGGRTFIAGADIKELEEAARNPASGGPNLHPLLTRIEDCSKPVIMAIHGIALGGGLEIAMAGHYRVAVPDASLGAPEVNLGIIPGAEGTQRLPRLVGVAAAVEMCVTGKPVRAPEALRMGLIDQVIEGELLAGAISFARNVAGEPVRKTRERNEKLGSAAENAPIFAAGRAQAGKIRRNQTAPIFALEALEAARTARFTTAEWDAYIAAGMAIQNERGALSLAHQEGREQGLEQGLRLGIEALCDAFGIVLSAERKRDLQTLDAAALEALLAKLRAERRWP